MVSKMFLFLLLLFNISFQQLFPHIIWVYWNTGLNQLGNFQKMCLQRMIYLHKDTDWQVNFVQEKTIAKYLSKDNYQRIYITFKNLRIMPQIKADLLRYYLLMQHGGVWLDISIILKQNLNWIDHLLENPKVLHKNIFKNPQAFIHYQHKTIQQQTIHIRLNGYDYYPLFQVQNAMVASVKGSRFISDWIDQFQKILKQGETLYNKIKNKLKIPYDFSPYFASFRACTINQYQKYLQYQEAKLQQKQINLQDHFYKVLILNRNAGMYHGSINQHRVSQFLLQKQGQYYGDYQTQMMKFSWRTKQFLKDLLSGSQIKKQQIQKRIDQQNYQFGKKYFYQQRKCFYQMKIHEESAIYKYFLFNEDLQKKFYPNVKITKQKQLPLICKISSLKTLRQIYPIISQCAYYSITTLLLIQFFFSYYFYSFKIKFSFQKDLLVLKNKLFIKLIFMIALYFQFCLIFSQYQLLKSESPTAVILGIAQIILTFIIFQVFLSVVFKNKKASIYIILPLILVLLVQHKLLYQFTVWNYEGEIYNYQTLTFLNKEKLKQFNLFAIKLCTLIVVFYMFSFCKWLFKLNKIDEKILQISFDSNTKKSSDYAPIVQKSQTTFQEITHAYCLEEDQKDSQNLEQQLHKN